MGVFAMPSLGSDMEAGTLVEWLVQPGDRVARGDVVAVVETQKGAIEIETFEAGVVHELTAELGRELPVGAPIAVILAEGESPPAQAAPAAAEAAAAAPEPATAGAPAPAPPAAPPRPGPAPPALKVSPAARIRARELGVDVAALEGTGPEGAVVLADVDRAAPAAAPAPKARAGGAMAEMRKAIAAAMTRSKRTIPHYYLSHTLDLEPAMRFLERRNAGRPPAERLLLGALLVRATALAVADVPALNGRWEEGEGFRAAETVNAGVAIALRGGGLVAPALMDAAALDLDATMAGMRDLVTRARAGRLRNSEMTEGTITVSSLGEQGPEAMIGVIFPPQVALVTFGAPQTRPWVAEGAVAPRRTIALTLSADHRASDGRQGARLVGAIAALMQTPEEL